MTRHRRGIELREAECPSASNRPISITTFGDLIRYRHKLTGYCRPCGTSRVFDPTSRPADEPFIKRIFRCKDCGSKMEISLTPPAWEPRQ